MSKNLNEDLVIIDNIAWLQKFVGTSLETLGRGLVILPSSTPMQKCLKRFKNASRILIHWESTHRHGGAIIEELLEIAPDYKVDEKIIVLTTNPRQEDVFYFTELSVQKVVRVAQHKAGFQHAFKEIKKFYQNSSNRSRIENAWSQLHKYIDAIRSPISEKQLKTISTAVDRLSEAQDGSQASARILDVKASMAYLLGQKEDAENKWHQSLEANPSFYRASRNLLAFYEKEQQVDRAMNLIQRLNQRNKNSITRMIQMGRLHRMQKRDDKAEHYFQLALEKDKYCSRALNGLAEIRFDQGEFDQARTLLKRSQCAVDTASYLNRQGIELVKRKEYKEALALYQNAQFVLPLQDKGPMLFYNIGLCYSRWGKIDRAKDYLRLALIKKPDYDKASLLLSKLGA